jgi:hypothetical protein
MSLKQHEHDVYICNNKLCVIFDIDELVQLSKNYEVKEIDISSLKNSFYEESYCVADKDTLNRIDNADLSYPIVLACNKKGKIIAVLDGTHRTRKAIKLGLKTIKAIVIPKKDLQHFKSKRILGKIIVGCNKLSKKELKLLNFYIEDYQIK